MYNSALVIANGVEAGLQSKHKTRGKFYPQLNPGTSHHYTEGAVAGFKVMGKARKSKFSQVVVEIRKDIAEVITGIMKTSPSARRAMSSSRVHRVSTNFFPSKSDKDVDDDDDECDDDDDVEDNAEPGCDGSDTVNTTEIYVKGTSAVPIKAFRLNKNAEYVVYPATASWRKEDGLYKFTVGVLPVARVHQTKMAVRDFIAEEDSDVLNIPSDVTSGLATTFREKWSLSNAADVNEDDDDAIRELFS
eukprot:scpid80097/ scgid3578/ 